MAIDTYVRCWRTDLACVHLRLPEPPKQLGGFGSALQQDGAGREWAQPLWVSHVTLD